jgi:hypothetical protein
MRRQAKILDIQCHVGHGGAAAGEYHPCCLLRRRKRFAAAKRPGHPRKPPCLADAAAPRAAAMAKGEPGLARRVKDGRTIGC